MIYLNLSIIIHITSLSNKCFFSYLSIMNFIFNLCSNILKIYHVPNQYFILGSKLLLPIFTASTFKVSSSNLYQGLISSFFFNIYIIFHYPSNSQNPHERMIKILSPVFVSLFHILFQFVQHNCHGGI